MAPFKKTAASMIAIAAGAWLVVSWVSQPDPSRDVDSAGPALATPAGADEQDLERPETNEPRSSVTATSSAKPVVIQASDIPPEIPPDANGLDDFEAYMAKPDAYPEAWLVIGDVLATNRLSQFTNWESFDRLMLAFQERVDAQGQEVTAQVQQALYLESGLAGGAVIPQVACGRRICVARLQSSDRAALKTFNLFGSPDRPPLTEISSSVSLQVEEMEGIFVQRVLFTLGYGLNMLPVEPAEQDVD